MSAGAVAGPAADPGLRRLAAGVVLPGFVGTTVPDWLRRALEQGLAGVCLFGQNVDDDAQVTALGAALHGVRRGVLVAADEEGGAVTRLDARTGSPWPAHATLGALDDEVTTARVARALGSAARARGVDLVLGPVADVGSEPDNPVIGERSFGADAAGVGRHVAAFVRGLQDAGVAACAKHFPGHGATRTDSHLALPVIDVDEPTWRARDLAPFADAVAAGVRCVMTAHVVVSCLDELPATLSARVLGLLRTELGFDGVVLTDALDMRAISDGVGLSGGAVRALAAGADLLCLGNPAFPDPYDDEAALEEVIGAVVEAVRAGDLERARLEEAAARVAVLGEWSAGRRPVALLGTEDDGFGVEVARRALAVHGCPRLAPGGRLLVAEPETSYAAGRSPSLVARLAPDRADVVHDPAEAARLAREATDVAVLVEGRAGAGTRAVVDAVLAERADAVVVRLGLDDPDAPPPTRGVRAHGGGLAATTAVLEALGLGVGDPVDHAPHHEHDQHQHEHQQEDA